MSVWQRPTTADIGIRAFSSDPEGLLSEVAVGMQDIMLSELGKKQVEDCEAFSSQWNIAIERETTWDRVLVKWLEEVIFQGEIEEKWLIQSQVSRCVSNLQIMATWVDSGLIEREIEIKAVTLHELRMEKIPHGKTVHSNWLDVPDIEGPGWICDVVFDI